MQVSHSRVDLFNNCPYRYHLSYGEKLTTIATDDPANALVLGTVTHTGMELGVEKAIEQYVSSYPVVTDEHINECIKLEYMIPKAKRLIPDGGQFEVLISTSDFKGFIDYLVPVVEDGEIVPNLYDLYDFKYSNNGDRYEESGQVHEYKYFFELTHPRKKIRNLYYLMIPKVSIKQKKTEDLFQFRKRLIEELENAEPHLLQVEFDYKKVVKFLLDTKKLIETKNFEKQQGWLCNYCEFKDYCEKGIDYMLLPKNERRNIEKVSKKVIWIYGQPFSGKTTFANKFPDPLMLNTDGNIKFVDAPYIAIKDVVTVTGRMTQRKFAWEVFKEVIAELERKENDFKTIIVDLLEDTYEHCRLYMYDKLSITHESDDSFRAWDKVRIEFLSTLKRLMSLDYENIILISHEDTSKDITKKSGDKITSIKPNLQDKASNKVAGMVDIVARVISDDGKYTLSFKSNEVVFGGGRLSAKVNEIPLTYDDFVAVYEDANKASANDSKNEEKGENRRSSSKRNKNIEKEENTPEIENKEVEEPQDEPVEVVQGEVEETPEETPDEPKQEVKVKTRKKRG